MTLDEAIKSLMALQAKLAAYGHAMGLLFYDGATTAPKGSAKNRAESLGVLSEETYRLQTGEETAALLQSAMTYSAATGGLFDVTVAPLVSLWGITTDSPRVPSQSEIDALLPLVGSGHIHMDGNAVTLDSGCAVDLGGIAKGYASDRVAQVLRQYAVTGVAVSLGGNVYVCGQKSDGSAWSVAVQDPKDTGAYAMTLELTDVFAVTSGGYQRYFTDSDGTVYQHILDPRTGRPAQTDLCLLYTSDAADE